MHTATEDHVPINPFEVRPRFELLSARSSADIDERFVTALEQEGTVIQGKTRRGYASLQPPADILHYWSPHVSITYEDTEEGTLIRGLYGPSPSVWTMFIFFYALIGMAILIITVIGLANLSIDNSGAILWALPVLVFLFFTLYIVSYTGQRKGHDQVEALHRFIESCVLP